MRDEKAAPARRAEPTTSEIRALLAAWAAAEDMVPLNRPFEAARNMARALEAIADSADQRAATAEGLREKVTRLIKDAILASDPTVATDAILALLPAAELTGKGEAEAAAWRRYYNGSSTAVGLDFTPLTEAAKARGWTETPLYAHAPDLAAHDEAIRAAERERCAALCEELADQYAGLSNDEMAFRQAATEMRALGPTPSAKLKAREVGERAAFCQHLNRRPCASPTPGHAWQCVDCGARLSDGGEAS